MDYARRASGLLVPRRHEIIRGHGRYRSILIRGGRVIDVDEFDNLIVNQGLDAILGTMFTGVQQITNWYLGIFQGNYVPVATDTAATIVGNSTECTSYSGTVRQPFNAVEGNQQVTNSASAATFSFTASATVYGGFLISSQQQSSTQGVLFSAAQFTSPKNVASGDQLVLTYLFTAQSS